MTAPHPHTASILRAALDGRDAANVILLSGSDYSDRATGHFVTIDGQAIFLHGPRASDSAGRKAQFHKAVSEFHRKEAGKASDPGEKTYHEKSAAIHDIHAKAQGEIAKVTGEHVPESDKPYEPSKAVAEKHAEAMGKVESGKAGDGKAAADKAADGLVGSKPKAGSAEYHMEKSTGHAFAGNKARREGNKTAEEFHHREQFKHLEKAESIGEGNGKAAADKAAGKTEYAIWGVANGDPDEQLLHTKATSLDMAKRLKKLFEEKYGATGVRIQTVNMAHNDLADRFSSKKSVIAPGAQAANTAAGFTAPASAVTPGVFGQSTVSAGTGKHRRS